MINQNRFDVAPSFSDPMSAQAMKPGANFMQPKSFDEQMAQVKRVLNIQFK